MRLQVGDRFPAELIASMTSAWKRQEKWLPDSIKERDDLLQYFLFNAGAQWYQVQSDNGVPSSMWFYLWNILPGLNADFYWISNAEIVERKEVRDAMKSAMREYDLRRLTLHLPMLASEALRVAQSFGFVQE